MTDPIERTIPTACELIDHVHTHNKKAIRQLLHNLNQQDIHALTIVLAAMIPEDRTIKELLAWTNQLPQLKPCGTHAAYARHKTNNEPIDPLCQRAERAYQRNKKREQRRAA